MKVSLHDPIKPKCHFCRASEIPMARLETEDPDTERPRITFMCQLCVTQINSVMRPYLK